MNLQNLDQYIHEVTETSFSLDALPLQEKLQNYIQSSQSSDTKSFFEAEAAFYAKDYEKAYELQKEFSEDERARFFFFRTAAYYLEELEDPEQAQYYAKKALEVFSGYTPWQEHLTALSQEQKEETSIDDDDVEFISVAPKELDELTDMFHDDQDEDEIRNILEENLPEERSEKSKTALPQSPYTPPKSKAPSGDKELNSPLDKAFFETQNTEIEKVNNYLDNEHRITYREPSFHTFNMERPSESKGLLSQASETQGYFFTWDRQGVLINPEPGFLDAFHQKGFTLKDVHAIFVTHSSVTVMEELKAIHTWNHQLNRLRDTPHYIQFHLPEKLHQSALKEFSFYNRQERNSVGSLCFYEGSKGSEKLPLSESLNCTYFKGPTENLGLSFQLIGSKGPKNLTFLTQMGWDAQLKSFIQDTDVLVVGFGKTAPHDYHKEKHLTDAIGRYGIEEILSTVAPELLLISECDINQKTLKWPIYQDIVKENQSSQSFILYSSNDFSINLETLGVNQYGKLCLLDELCTVKIDNEVKIVYKQDIL